MNVRIRTSEGWVEVPAAKVKNGLALTNVGGSADGALWSVTHVRTGRRVGGVSQVSGKELKVFNRIVGLIDWTQNMTALRKAFREDREFATALSHAFWPGEVLAMRS